jgi:membrane protease YdiL (CAAX protease family)
MATPGAQLEPQIVSTPETTSISNAQRWTDLALVMAVAFAASIVGSIYLAFRPEALNHSNTRLLAGIVDQSTTLCLFWVLFKRQGRRLNDIGFGFRWTDLPKALGLTLAAFAAIMAVYYTVNYFYFITTGHLLDRGPRWNFASASVWAILPFLVLNAFFEEMLVRGYLMTELIDLRKSVVFAAVVSLVVQTSYHLYYGVFGAVMVGCGMSVFVIYYAKSRRLMPVILAHMFWDLTTVFLRPHS